MKKLVRITLAGAFLVSLAGAPNQARAVAFEDSLQDCSYPGLFDLMVMRPLSLSALALGTALYLPLAPWTVLTAGDAVTEVTDKLILAPARFTFSRPLGECATRRTF